MVFSGRDLIIIIIKSLNKSVKIQVKMRRRIILENNKKSGNDWVDLGLPSGLLWATHNVGAESETDYGNYYQYGKGARDYFVTSGESDYAGTENPLKLSADTAYQAWGDTWRMPTSAECRELTANTTYQWTNINGVNGGKFTNKSNDEQYIFVPAAGSYSPGYLGYNVGTFGYIRSATPNGSSRAYKMHLSVGGIGIDYVDRYYAYSVRPVRDNSAWPVGNVLFYNTVSDKKQVFPMLEWPEASDGWTPIGIEVVPREHDRYGDGSGGFMSLVGMDYNYPETGIPVTGTSQTDDVIMYWGCYGSSTGNYMFVSTSAFTAASGGNVLYQGNSSSTVCYLTGTDIWPYNATKDGATFYLSSAASTTYVNTNGYVKATTGKSGCDFNGIRNTAAMYVRTRTAAQWTANTVTNNTGSTNTPPIACAGRYKTVGTKSFLDVYTGITSNSTNYGTTASTKENTGYWYLPACGELCYLPSKRYEINKTILVLNRKYGNVGIMVDAGTHYYSSSEYDREKIWYVDIGSGQMYYLNKNAPRKARAFLRF